ncbi:hypothetical protein LHO93_004547 [Vibrio parahaemolyticus]|nr:hypothetical protein [Vibrio parahaemolyticus]EHY0970384.1 hypothetical protein [Vibrio parahaemolyticus]EHZ7340050.1 hypothetical protein [Vibrio parahaemolyticus]EHZ7354559.1 hypothetical protein [Vibrio parahaemolyticus]EIA1329056.1 hypothetical protein [Vibrio parahaemolyticus]
MKPLGTNNAVENGLTTPEKTSFQQVNKLLNQQTHRADLQPKTDFRLPHPITTKERNNRLGNSNALT